MVPSVLARCLGLELLPVLLLLHLADLCENNFPEDSSLGNLAQTPLMRGAGRAFRRAQATTRRVACQCLASCLLCVCRHVCLAGHVFLFVFLHPERLDTVGKLDKLDTAAKTRLCDISTDLGKQVVVRGSLALEPRVCKSLLYRD